MISTHFIVILGDGERPQFSGGIVLAINRIGHRKDQQSHCNTGQWYGYNLMHNIFFKNMVNRSGIYLYK